jgi:hypothetical protein
LKKLGHKFFEIVKACETVNGFKMFPGINKAMFFRQLKQSHPFVFDAKCTDEALTKSSNFEPLSSKTRDGFVTEKKIRVRDVIKDAASLAEDFSLPFKNVLYILTKPLTIIIKDNTEKETKIIPHGYLVSEISPEKFKIFNVSEYAPCERDRKKFGVEAGIFFPGVDSFDLNLSSEDKNVEELTLIMRLTQMISVKRIGVERNVGSTFPAKGVGIGHTTVKYDNIIHIADKVEYLYDKQNEESDIDYDYVGFWRGHWRAFYSKDSRGETRKDHRGWNVVDYGRLGKDREGHYDVPGYTWVKEHTKGDPALAEIKTRLVKHK